MQTAVWFGRGFRVLLPVVFLLLAGLSDHAWAKKKGQAATRAAAPAATYQPYAGATWSNHQYSVQAYQSQTAQPLPGGTLYTNRQSYAYDRTDQYYVPHTNQTPSYYPPTQPTYGYGGYGGGGYGRYLDINGHWHPAHTYYGYTDAYTKQANIDLPTYNQQMMTYLRHYGIPVDP